MKVWCVYKVKSLHDECGRLVRVFSNPEAARAYVDSEMRDVMDAKKYGGASTVSFVTEETKVYDSKSV